MTGLILLALTGVAVVVLLVTTARPPAVAPTDRAAYFDRWQVLHGGYDPRTGSVPLRGWLTLVHGLARPLARAGVQPDAVTISSIWVAGLVLVLCDAGGHWWVLAGLGMVAGGLCDTLDGCLAVLQNRTTRWGYVLDSVVDRINDTLYLVALVLVGCPGWLAVACGFGCFLLEYLRARAGNAGGDEVGLITMAERPTRVIVLSLSVLLSGVFPSLCLVLSALGPAVLLIMTAVSVVQLGLTVRRQLAALPSDRPR
jgi:phosphatidylglycerophosphate synthase